MNECMHAIILFHADVHDEENVDSRLRKLHSQHDLPGYLQQATSRPPLRILENVHVDKYINKVKIAKQHLIKMKLR